jgi:hypothetical protein
MEKIEVLCSGKALPGFQTSSVLLGVRRLFPNATEAQLSRFVAGAKFVVTTSADRTFLDKAVTALCAVGADCFISESLGEMNLSLDGASNLVCNQVRPTLSDSRNPSSIVQNKSVAPMTARKGPFGLSKGMIASEFAGSLSEIGPGKYEATVVPKPHSAFERYIVQISPRAGLSWIKGIGRDIQTSVYGVELVAAFDAMEQKLVAAYGKQERMDFLMHESIWNEPREWTQAMLSKERILMSQWSKESGAALSDSLASVALVTGVTDTSTGYIAIEYSFDNCESAEAEIASMEDDAL